MVLSWTTLPAPQVKVVLVKILEKSTDIVNKGRIEDTNNDFMQSW